MSRITFTRPDGTAVAVEDEATFLEALEAKFAEWKNQIGLRYGSPLNGWSEDASLLLNKTLTALISDDIDAIGSYQFYEFVHLTDVNLQKATTIGGNAFGNCSTLTRIICPNVTIITDMAFSNCKKLSEVYFPKVVTANSVFNGLESLYRLYLPSCTTITKMNSMSIGKAGIKSIVLLPVLSSIPSGFKGYSNADQRIVLPQSYVIPALNAGAITTGSAIYCVPARLLASYKVATNWSSGTQFIQAIEDDPDILAYMAEVGYDYTPTTAEVSE